MTDGVNEPSPAMPALPRPPFLKPLLRWLFLLALPAELTIAMVAVYIHEFAHGLTALATGGYFLGVRGAKLTQKSPIFAYADAWSLDHHAWVMAAGIAVNVALGVFFLWRATRARSLMPRILLFLTANVFLSDFHYALEGCLAADDAHLDTAMFLQELGSAPWRWGVLLFSATGLLLSTCAVARGLFRCWEQVFGALSVGRGLWVILLLSFPAPIPALSADPALVQWSVSLLFLVGISVWLLLTRNREAVAVPVPSFRTWALGSFAAALIAVVGIVVLWKGIRFGTYPASYVRDIHPDRQAVAGVSILYGMGDQLGENRPAKGTLLFVATRDGTRVVGVPPSTILDVAWLPDRDRVIAVCAEGLMRVDLSPEKVDWRWKPERGRITEAEHGRRGEIVAIVDDPSEGDRRIYVYDGARDMGTLHENRQTVGRPVFDPSPGKAWITVGDDLWELDWLEGGRASGVTLHAGASKGLWLAGLSGEQRWFSDATHWVCGDARVAFEGITYWVIGADGLYANRANKTWQLIRPDGDQARSGNLDPDTLLGFQLRGSVPWVALQSGVVHPIDNPGAAFRVLLPK